MLWAMLAFETADLVKISNTTLSQLNGGSWAFSSPDKTNLAS